MKKSKIIGFAALLLIATAAFAFKAHHEAKAKFTTVFFTYNGTSGGQYVPSNYAPDPSFDPTTVSQNQGTLSEIAVSSTEVNGSGLPEVNVTGTTIRTDLQAHQVGSSNNFTKASDIWVGL